MVPEPLADFLDPRIVLITKLIHVYSVEMNARFFRMEMILPGTRKELVQVIMQIAVDQYFPFMGIQPDTVTTATAVEIEVGIWKNFIACHNMPAVRTQLEFRHVPIRIDLDRAVLYRNGTTQGPPPCHIVIRGDEKAIAIGTLRGGQALQQGNLFQFEILADGALHDDLRRGESG